MNKLVYEGNEYELHEVGMAAPYFLLTQDAPYPIEHFHDKEYYVTNHYRYKTLQINGKSYGFKMIKHE